MKRTILMFIASVALLFAAEVWLRKNLFQHVSYSNSESIDAQLRDRDRNGPWSVLFVGDSEVRWGIDPDAMDRGLSEGGVKARSFNHAFDGFGASWWSVLLPQLLQSHTLDNVHTVVLGVQMTEVHSFITPNADHCGALQRPVLTSPFGVDIGFGDVCQSRAWDSQFGRQIFSPLWSVRYASAVRTLLLPEAVSGTPKLKFNSRKAGEPVRGFQPHRSISQDEKEANSEFDRWKRQFNPEKDFKPLPPEAWEQMLAVGGFFDEFQTMLSRSGRRLVLFALPTSPMVIDTFHRREDYQRNSRLLSQWATSKGVTFVDLGIQDRRDAKDYFSDMRHLSGVGAADFSLRLGRILAPEIAARQGTGAAPSNNHSDTGGQKIAIGQYVGSTQASYESRLIDRSSSFTMGEDRL